MMKLFDVNVLLHAMNADSPRHGICFEQVAYALEKHELLWVDGIAAGVVRIATSKHSIADPFSTEECFQFLKPIFEQGIPPSPENDPWPVFQELVTKHELSGPSVQDAYWAAIAVTSKATFVTLDKGFTRFNNLNLQLLAF